LGYILYDTGYSMDILKNNLKYFLYRFANPITLKREDMIDFQLKEKGIDVTIGHDISKVSDADIVIYLLIHS